VVLVFFINKRFAAALSIIGCCFFLYYWPTIGHFGPDYLGYVDVFENAYYNSSYPYYQSKTRADVEILYEVLNSWFNLRVSNDFRFFLIFNYLLSMFLIYMGLRKFKPFYFYCFTVMLLPVIFPTIFYYLLRSSLSFSCCFLGLCLLTRKKHWFGLLFLYLGFNLHTQYLLISLLIIFTYVYFFIYKKEHIDLKFYKDRILFFGLSLTILLIISRYFTGVTESLLSFLPSSDLAQGKLGYLSDEKESGFRITSILSIIVYPIISYRILVDKFKTNKTFFVENNKIDTVLVVILYAIFVYGASINISFITDAHVAGRLSRFSDYTGLSLLFYTFLNNFYTKEIERIIIFILFVIVPVLYPAVYLNTNWNIF
jgi:hypothetical protein